MSVLLQSAGVFTLETFDGLSLMDGVCSVGTYTTHLSSLGFSKKRDYNYKKQHSFIRPHS